jgi:hypothetical protein
MFLLLLSGFLPGCCGSGGCTKNTISSLQAARGHHPNRCPLCYRKYTKSFLFRTVDSDRRPEKKNGNCRSAIPAFVGRFVFGKSEVRLLLQPFDEQAEHEQQVAQDDDDEADCRKDRS